MERLEAAGYVQYEISNVARPGPESRHNLKYWQDGEWLGFGCGAHSTRDGVRWKNVVGHRGLHYVASRPDSSVVAEHRVLSRESRLEEALFTGLRLTAGLDLDSVGQQYENGHLGAICGGALRPSLEAGLAVRDGSRLRLSRDGMLLANEILSVFV